MKQQVVVIHGGDAFNTHDEYLVFLKSFPIENLEYFSHKSWKAFLPESLGEGFEVIAPQMPSKINAKYNEWSIWFQKLLPLLNEKIILVGHSLGGIFLTKYLSENRLNKTILATFLIAPAPGEGDFELPNNAETFQKQGGQIFIYQSKDDRVVPFATTEKYQSLLPNAKVEVFEDRGHFNQESFPEIVEAIKNAATS